MTSAPRPGWTYRSVLFAILIVLSAICAYVGPRGMPVVLGVGFLAALPQMRWSRPAALSTVAPMVLGLFAGISILWSPLRGQFDPLDLEAFTAFKIIIQVTAFSGLSLAAVRMSRPEGDRVAAALLFSSCALAALLIVDSLFVAGLYQQFNRLIGETVRPDLAARNVAQGAYILAVLLWPTLVVIGRKAPWELALLPVAGVLAALTLGADAPIVGLLSGALAYAVVRMGGRYGVLALGGAVAAWWLAAPWLVLAAKAAGLIDRAKSLLPPSWDARSDIWVFAAEQITAKPLFGSGVGASRAFAEIPLHTHSAPIQHWLELGVVGAVLAALLWSGLFWQIARRVDDRGWQASAAAALTAFLAISSLSFSAWEEWWLAAGGLALIICISLSRTRPADPRRARGSASFVSRLRTLTLLWRARWGKSPAFPPE